MKVLEPNNDAQILTPLLIFEHRYLYISCSLFFLYTIGCFIFHIHISLNDCCKTTIAIMMQTLSLYANHY